MIGKCNHHRWLSAHMLVTVGRIMQAGTLTNFEWRSDHFPFVEIVFLATRVFVWVKGDSENKGLGDGERRRTNGRKINRSENTGEAEVRGGERGRGESRND